MNVEFVETAIFTRLITLLLEDNEYRSLQSALAADLEVGDLISGSGGLRKLRWAVKKKQKGKRGGARIIYYVHSHDKLYMIYAYVKGKQENLTKKELMMLREYTKEAQL